MNEKENDKKETKTDYIRKGFYDLADGIGTFAGNIDAESAKNPIVKKDKTLQKFPEKFQKLIDELTQYLNKNYNWD